LDLRTNAEEFGGPMEIQAMYSATGRGGSSVTLTFDPAQYKERAGLLISNGVVYTSFASHCDINPYNGWVIGYSEPSLAQVSVLNLTPNGSEGAIWQAGAGPAADAVGNLYFLMANGTFDTTLNASGFPEYGDYGNAFMKLWTAPSLAVADYFTMDNTVSESNGDTDLGSGGAMLTPTLMDANGNPLALGIGAGKDGTAYVVNLNNMGKYNSGTDNNAYQHFGLGGGVFSSPAWFNNTLYYGPVSAPLEAFPFANGFFKAASSETSLSFTYPGTTPSISANGSSYGIVWAAENQSSAVLHAYDAGNLSNELYNTNQASDSRDQFGAGNKFITPTVANGKVYLGTTNGVGAFGLLNCTYSLTSLPSFPLSASASSSTVGVSAPSGCSWSVANTSNFVTVTAGASGTGNGTVSFSVPANLRLTLTRSGVLMIAGQTFTVTQAGSSTPLPGDFNQDGYTDLLWQNTSSGTAAVWYLTGAEGNNYQSWNSLGTASGWTLVGAADLNADGHPDLIWQNNSTGQVAVWYMGGAQGNVYQSWTLLSGNMTGWTLVDAADLNGDGHPDLIWQNNSTGQVAVWYMGGAQGNVYQSWALLSGNMTGWTLVDTADLNGDGTPDLIWQNKSTGQVAAWYMGGTQGNVYQSWSWLAAGNMAGWTLVGAADLNADGHPDLIWQLNSTGQVAVWYMGGAQGNVYQSWNWVSSGNMAGWRAIATLN
jgi:hypothetical protein